MLVSALKGLKVVDVACGSGDAQTLAVTENGTLSLFSDLEWDCPSVLSHPTADVLMEMYLKPVLHVSLQVRCGPGAMETMVNWVEEAVMAARHLN